NGLRDNAIFTLAEDARGDRWMGGPVGGAMRLSGAGVTTFDQTDGLAGARVADIFETKAGQLFVVRRQGRFSLFYGPRLPEAVLTLPKARGADRMDGPYKFPVIQDHTGEWGVATGAGLYRFTATDGPAKLRGLRPKAVYTTQSGLPTNIVVMLFEDSRGDIW